MFFKIDYSKLPKLKLYLEVNLGNVVLADDIGLLTEDVQIYPKGLQECLWAGGRALQTLSDSVSQSKLYTSEFLHFDGKVQCHVGDITHNSKSNRHITIYLILVVHDEIIFLARIGLSSYISKSLIFSINF